MESEVDVLSRAHHLFAGSASGPTLDAGTETYRGMLQRAAGRKSVASESYSSAVGHSRRLLQSAARTNDAAAVVLAGAHRDHAHARALTKSVLDESRADTTASPGSPMAHREAMRRRADRLRRQRAHVSSARSQARRHAAALRALHYRLHRRQLPSPDGRAAVAVRAALSRLGRPYVWGATGPDRFDCSGLVQWSWAQAGVHLNRTTYQQINDGIPVPLAQVRPGDLVFPHLGHVQMAIGNNLVVEAPYPGASVRISRLGGHVAIRRPL